MKPLSVFLTITTVLTATVSQKLKNECPKFEEDAPNCYCVPNAEEQFPVMVTCKGIADSQELLKSMQAMVGYKIDHLQLIDIHLQTWPPDVFKGVFVDFLHIENSDIESLASEGGTSIFSGLETSLRYLSLLKLNNLTTVDWSLVAVAKSLQALSVVLTPLMNLSSTFSTIGDGQIYSVSMMGTNISEIEEGTFSGLRNVTDIRLTSNNLTEIKRSMFPSPAPDLMELSLMLNQISQLPEDIFSDMPSLRNVFLDHNQLTHLSEKVFSPIWNKLSTLSVNGNPLHCDCRFRWFANITKTVVPRSNDFSWVTCESPPNLKGRELSSLKMDELECPEP